MTRRGFLAKIGKNEPGIPTWPEFYLQCVDFHEAWMEFLGTTLGCENPRQLENCRPRVGVLAFKKYLKTRGLAAKLFNLKE